MFFIPTSEKAVLQGLLSGAVISAGTQSRLSFRDDSFKWKSIFRSIDENRVFVFNATIQSKIDRSRIERKKIFRKFAKGGSICGGGMVVRQAGVVSQEAVVHWPNPAEQRVQTCRRLFCLYMHDLHNFAVFVRYSGAYGALAPRRNGA